MHSRTSLLVACLLALACAPCVALAQDATPAADAATADLVPRLDPNAPDPAPPHPELAGVFQDFGGRPGLDALMEDFMANLLAAPRTAPYFENKELPRIKRQLAEQFCAILGGGCAYSGRDMRSTHTGMGVDRAAFNALVEDLQAAMDKHRVPFRSQNKLLAILAPMHREVVGQ